MKQIGNGKLRIYDEKTGLPTASEEILRRWLKSDREVDYWLPPTIAATAASSAAS